MTSAERQARIERLFPEVIVHFLSGSIPADEARGYATPARAAGFARRFCDRADLDALSDEELLRRLCAAMDDLFLLEILAE